MYVRDIDRIQDALIPTLFRCLLLMHLSYNESLRGDLLPKIQIIDKELDGILFGLDDKKKRQIARRVIRVCEKMEGYFKKEKFCSRKCFLAMFAWAAALYDAGALEFKGDFWELMLAMKKMIMKGYAEIENFDKIDLSAINHVEKIHKLVQEEGYFV